MHFEERTGEDRAISHERRELFISTVPGWCLKSVAVLTKGAYRYSYRNAGAALGVALSNSARVYTATTLIPRLQPASPSRRLESAARSVIFQTAAKPLSRDKRAFKPRTKARVTAFRSAIEFKVRVNT